MPFVILGEITLGRSNQEAWVLFLRDQISFVEFETKRKMFKRRIISFQLELSFLLNS